MPAELRKAADPFRWSRLIAQVARGDRAAFADLFSHFAPRVKTFLVRAGVSESGAEEMAQEALLIVWRKAAHFDPQSSGAAAWIFTIARNLRIDALRRARRRPSQEAAARIDDLVDDAPAPDQSLAATQAEHRVRTALAALSEEQKQVVDLSFFAGRPHGEIAQSLCIPLGTVKSRLRLAMERLRKLLGDLE